MATDGVGAFPRVDVVVKSIKERQTYYGALDYLTKRFVVQEYGAGNEDNTVAFLQYLQSCFEEETRLVIIWDGASYHRSAGVQEFLQQRGWQLTPKGVENHLYSPGSQPEQNPVEDVWLQAKQFIRKYARRCNKFWSVKVLFELFTHCQTFAFAKAFMYGYCSSPI